MKAPSSSLDYERWAREQVPVRKLTRGQAQVLTLLASYADRRGECFPSNSALAERAVLSVRHTERLLAELAELKLITSSRRGRGASARRRLCPDAPLPAPPCPRGTMPLFDASLTPRFDAPDAPVAPAVVAIPEPPLVSSEPSSGGGQKEQQEGRTAVCENAPALKRAPAVVSPSLPAVLEVLSEAPNAHVEDAHIDIVLRSFPDGDHVGAAQYVLLQLLQPDCRCRTASLLLHTQLRNERRAEADRQAGRGSVPHGGRRRPAPPLQVSPAGRRWGPTDNKYDRAAGLL